MKVCFLSHTSQLGGAERVLLETIEVLHEKGVECYVLLPGEGAMSQRLAAIGVPYDFIQGSSWVTWKAPTFWEQIKAIIKIALGVFPTLKKIRKSGCDIVYSNTLTVCDGGIAAAILQRPHVWHLHEFPGYHGVRFYFGNRFSFLIVRALSSACITVSTHLSEMCRPYLQSSRMKVIHPSMHLAFPENVDSVPAGRLLPPRNGRFRCVIVGGLFEGKRALEAVEALGELRRGGVDAELLIVGDGDPRYRHSLEDCVKANDLLGNVTFTGAVREGTAAMRSADVVLVCSRHETFGRVTVEAMMAGKPVVCAGAAATPELVRDGFNGWLYEPGNHRDLAAKIKLLYEDRPLAVRLGENGRTWAQGAFTKELYAREILNILTTLNQAAPATN